MKFTRARTPIIKITTAGVRAVLYTCPQNCTTKVPLVYIVNASGTTSLTFELYKADVDTHFYILAGKNLATGEAVQLSDGYIVLEAGDKLEVTCTGSTIDVNALCTAEETFKPVG